MRSPDNWQRTFPSQLGHAGVGIKPLRPSHSQTPAWPRPSARASGWGSLATPPALGGHAPLRRLPHWAIWPGLTSRPFPDGGSRYAYVMLRSPAPRGVVRLLASACRRHLGGAGTRLSGRLWGAPNSPLGRSQLKTGTRAVWRPGSRAAVPAPDFL